MFVQIKYHTFFQREMIKKKRKHINDIWKSSSQEALGQLNQTFYKASFDKGIKVCSNEGPRPFPREIITILPKYIEFFFSPESLG